jgi:hypothetical protein
MIEFVPHIGDFIAVGEPLFRLHRRRRERSTTGACTPSVALGSERTMEQDPTFALRISSTSAIKALSAAINDPTTAVMAIDQLHRLLRLVGLRDCATRSFGTTPECLGLLLHAELGRLRPPDLHRDPPLRRRQRPDRAPDAFDARNLLQSLPPHRHAELHGSSTSSTARSRLTSASRKTVRWRASPTRKGSAARSAWRRWTRPGTSTLSRSVADFRRRCGRSDTGHTRRPRSRRTRSA